MKWVRISSMKSCESSDLGNEVFDIIASMDVFDNIKSMELFDKITTIKIFAFKVFEYLQTFKK